MLTDINENTIKLIKNSVFKEYAYSYLDILKNFIQQVEQFGISFDKNAYIESETKEVLNRLYQKQAIFRNDNKSIYNNFISPACEACAKAIGSVTMYISLMCHRNCYYCFNANQEEYGLFNNNKRDWKEQLENMIKIGTDIDYLALSGGEPLLHKEDTLDYFQYIQQNLKNVHTRLYTSGDLLDEKLARELCEAGLKEIRFSVKLEDNLELYKTVLKKIELARGYIPKVIVEMPVIPGTFERMKQLLFDLEELKVDGINLLEFCFPYNNVKEYVKRGFKLKYPPFKVLYNYWYSGGLAVSESELLSLKLLEFILDNHLKLGAHYCSLENKNTGQIYKQNTTSKFTSKNIVFSNKDYYLKTAKVFGKDTARAILEFRKNGIEDYEENIDYDFIQFQPEKIKYLKNTGIEVAISYNVTEERDNTFYLREVKVDYTTPETFSLKDI
ncbi:radical SAM protein [Clostridium arbusti]|uniref:radical SAM protein n=1 Tax=Clostridium arbusti TaxID=1137848 RepID=UPI0002892567|nr:radical SAM protein [Clostridium arbusti]